jgi:glycosyltransferase involved in cell wall biosynthesis
VRIARILTRLNLGGPARQALASDPWLQARGHELRVFVGEPEAGEGDLAQELAAQGVSVVRVPGMGRQVRPWADARARRFLVSALREYAPDLVHTHASKAGALGRRAAWKLGLPTVHTFHGHVLAGYFPAPVSWILRRVEARLARGTTRVLAVSQATAQDLVSFGVLPAERIHLQPPGVVLDGFGQPDQGAGSLRGPLGIPAEALVVGVIGRLAEVKRPCLALESFAIAAQQEPRLHLVYVGDGAERGKLEAAAARLTEEVARRVHLAGPRERMGGVYQDLDLVLGASRSEGLPVAFIEAGAAGLPVVSTPVGGVPELVEHGRTGVLAEDARGLAAGLLELAQEPGKRHTMGGLARERALERHSAAALGAGLEAHYRQVLGR